MGVAIVDRVRWMDLFGGAGGVQGREEQGRDGGPDGFVRDADRGRVYVDVDFSFGRRDGGGEGGGDEVGRVAGDVAEGLRGERGAVSGGCSRCEGRRRREGRGEERDWVFYAEPGDEDVERLLVFCLWGLGAHCAFAGETMGRKAVQARTRPGVVEPRPQARCCLCAWGWSAIVCLVINSG